MSPIGGNTEDSIQPITAKFCKLGGTWKPRSERLFSGDGHHQVKDVPSGTQIDIVMRFENEETDKRAGETISKQGGRSTKSAPTSARQKE